MKIHLNKHKACRTHCCVLHGCKYGHEDCPVCNALIKQKYLCEYCGMDFGPNNVKLSESGKWSKINKIFLKENRKHKLKMLSLHHD